MGEIVRNYTCPVCGVKHKKSRGIYAPELTVQECRDMIEYCNDCRIAKKRTQLTYTSRTLLTGSIS